MEIAIFGFFLSLIFWILLYQRGKKDFREDKESKESAKQWYISEIKKDAQNISIQDFYQKYKYVYNNFEKNRNNINEALLDFPSYNKKFISYIKKLEIESPPRETILYSGTRKKLDDVCIGFINELKTEFFGYERYTLKNYCRTGNYFPNQNLYDKIVSHVNNGLKKHEDLMHEAQRPMSGISINYRMSDQVWGALWTRKENLEEYNLLTPKSKNLFLTWDRSSLYDRSILGIDKRIRKFHREARKLWIENEDYYKQLKLNNKI